MACWTSYRTVTWRQAGANWEIQFASQSFHNLASSCNHDIATGPASTQASSSCFLCPTNLRSGQVNAQDKQCTTTNTAWPTCSGTLESTLLKLRVFWSNSAIPAFGATERCQTVERAARRRLHNPSLTA